MDEAIIEVNHLTKVYPNGFKALKDISFEVKTGEILGYLGPNGAGKTTTINILTGCLPQSTGSVKVLGYSVPRENAEIRKRIGIASQDLVIDWPLTVRDNLQIYGLLRHINRVELNQRLSNLLEDFNLADKRDEMCLHLSGGEARRLQIARALLDEPRLIFLDEPTLGLDPQGKEVAWKYIKKLAEKGVTIFLATNDMREAERLCKRIIFINKGQVISSGSPDQLKKEYVGLTLIELACDRDFNLGLMIGKNEEIENFEGQGSNWKITTRGGDRILPKLVYALQKEGIQVKSIIVRSPDLNDIFLEIVGKYCS